MRLIVPLTIISLIMFVLFIFAFYYIYKNRVMLIDNRDEIKKLSVKVDQHVVKLTSSMHELSSTSDFNDQVIRAKQRRLENMH